MAYRHDNCSSLIHICTMVSNLNLNLLLINSYLRLFLYTYIKKVQNLNISFEIASVLNLISLLENTKKYLWTEEEEYRFSDISHFIWISNTNFFLSIAKAHYVNIGLNFCMSVFWKKNVQITDTKFAVLVCRYLTICK